MIRLAVIAIIALLCTCALSDDALSYLHKHVSDYNTELIDLVNIPSISSLPEHKEDMLSAATWLQMRLKQAGLQVDSLDCYLSIPVVHPCLVLYGTSTSTAVS